ncbi:MAG: hypothetical protein J6Y43_04990 [Clostridia bacterium]|nr:hypothetical protein [Clostridia bacterium]
MKTKKNLVLAVLSVCILALSLAFALVDALVPLEVWTHPLLNFLFCVLLGFGIMTVYLGFAKSSPWYFFLSSIMLGLAFFYALVQYVPWWICLLIVIVVWAIFGIMSFMKAGNQTEDIALNKSPDYKTFEQRKAEEAAAKAEEKKNAKPLPEIKSFKDKD